MNVPTQRPLTSFTNKTTDISERKAGKEKITDTENLDDSFIFGKIERTDKFKP